MGFSLPQIDRAPPLICGGHPLISDAETVNQVRNKVFTAGVRTHKSWEELFQLCDKNDDGQLDSREVKHMIRGVLKVHNTTVSDHELSLLLGALDKDGSQTVDLNELFDFLLKGPQDESLKKAKKIKRVKRNLRLAFNSVSTNEADIRKLFSRRDFDASGKISRYELLSFVREELGMNRWDLSDADLNEFYNHLDRDNSDGIDIEEFWQHIKAVGREKHQRPECSDFLSRVGADLEASSSKRERIRRWRTYKQGLVENIQKHSRSTSLPALSPTFSEQGRDRQSRRGRMFT
jgi:Ca2+-binding EF-hand superfamily protein